MHNMYLIVDKVSKFHLTLFDLILKRSFLHDSDFLHKGQEVIVIFTHIPKGQHLPYTLRKKVHKPSLGLYLFKRENFCPF